MAQIAPYGALYGGYLPKYGQAVTGGSATRVAVKCLWHDDGKPSAFVDYATGVYHCPVCNLSLSAVGFISKLTGLSYKEADIIVSEYKNKVIGADYDDSYFSKSPTRKPEWDEMVKLSHELMSPDLEIVKEYCNRKNLKYETLIKAGVGFLPAKHNGWNQDVLVFPYMIQGHVWGIRYRNIRGEKSGESGTTFYLWGVNDVPVNCNSIIITEGETDRLTAMEMFPDIPVVSTPTCAMKEEWKREFSDISTIMLIPQSDGASKNLIKSVTDILGESVVVAQLPWKRGQLGKDLNDWRAKNDEKRFVRFVTAEMSSDDWFEDGTSLSSSESVREYYINEVLSPGQLGCIVGPMKAKKTFTMLNMMRTLLGGGPFLGLPQATLVKDIKHILVVEEEGGKADLELRVKDMLEDVDWATRTTWIFKRGVKIDNERWIEKLSKLIEQRGTNILFLDCLQKLHSLNEDKAQEMALVWRNLRMLLHRHPQLSIVFIHHFNKSGDITKGWNAIRGSSSLAGEVDLAIFQEKRETKDGEEIVVKFDGREIRELGDEPHSCSMYAKGIINLNVKEKAIEDRRASFMLEMEDRTAWRLKDCAEFFGMTTETVRRWATSQPDKYYVTKPAPGSPAMICVIKEGEAK